MFNLRTENPSYFYPALTSNTYEHEVTTMHTKLEFNSVFPWP